MRSGRSQCCEIVAGPHDLESLAAFIDRKAVVAEEGETRLPEIKLLDVWRNVVGPDPVNGEIDVSPVRSRPSGRAGAVRRRAARANIRSDVAP